jgi:hypothetical protein
LLSNGRKQPFQWAEAKISPIGRKSSVHRRRPAGRKLLQDSNLFRTFAVEKYSCALRQQMRDK